MKPDTVINGLEIDNCAFVSPNYYENDIGFVLYSALADSENGQGGYLNNAKIHLNWFHDLKRMGDEITNQENKNTSTPISRYNNISIYKNVCNNTFWGAVKYCAEAVGTRDFTSPIAIFVAVPVMTGFSWRTMSARAVGQSCTAGHLVAASKEVGILY